MIRIGCAGDKAQIMSVIQNAINDMDSKGINQWDSIYPNEDVISDDINNGELYVYEDNGIIMGIIVLNEYQDVEYQTVQWEFNSGRQLVVHRLCIAPQHQGKGIAKFLMGFAEQHGKSMGYESIRFDAFADNGRACSFYKKLGYKIAGTVYFRKGKFYCLEKALILRGLV